MNKKYLDMFKTFMIGTALFSIPIIAGFITLFFGSQMNIFPALIHAFILAIIGGLVSVAYVHNDKMGGEEE